MAKVASDAPYTLVQIESPPPSAPSSLLPTPLTLTWHNLSVSASGQPSKNRKSSKDPKSPADETLEHQPHKVLDDVSGGAHPGELVAIVAPSRGTALALLTAIAGRPAANSSSTSGFVRVNGHSALMSSATLGFVPRDDLMYATLTVQEHLLLQARLRLGSNESRDEYATRVAHVLGETGLSEVATSLIGNGSAVPAPGVLSPHNRKLLALATELLMLPSIVLLDEPLAGLSAFAATSVVRRLQSLARKGHTVVLTSTFDQLTSAMFSIFDKLHVLVEATHTDAGIASGRTVFHGKPLDSLTFFQANGLACPTFTNPFEFFSQELIVREGTGDVAKKRVSGLVDAWEAAAPHEMSIPVLEPPREDGIAPYSNNLATQLAVLLRRNALRISHDGASVRGRVIQSIAIAVVIGIIFVQLDITQTTLQSFGSLCFFITAIQFITNAVPEFLSVPKEVALVLREHANGQYHALSWYIVKNISELPFQLLYPLLFLVPTYFLVGFPTDAEVFFTFYLFAFLIASAGVAVALFASCVAPKPKLAIVISIAIIAPSMIFGGPFLNRKTTPVYFVWLQQMLPVKYCYHGLLRGFWSSVESIYCAPGTMCRATTGQAVLAMNIVKPDKFSSDWQILLAINLALRVLGGLVLWRRAASRAPRKSD